MKTPKKKLSYKEIEGLLADAHRKLDILASKFHELQTYFIAYVEYKGENIMFNDWMNDKIKETKNELQKNEQSDEPNMEGSPTH